MGRFIGGGRNSPATETPEGPPRNGNSEAVCLPERDGELPPVFCGRNLSDSCIGKARGMLRGLFLCRFESLREEAPPWGENGQRCCGLKAPMVLIRSSKLSRETSVCPLIFER